MKNTPLLSLSQEEKGPPCGEALPFDPGPTEGIPNLTVTSSSIPSGMFFGRRFKMLTSKRRMRGASSSGEDNPHDGSYVTSQLEAASSYGSGFYDIDM
jgi:hypothetical protein